MLTKMERHKGGISVEKTIVFDFDGNPDTLLEKVESFVPWYKKEK